MQDKPQSEQCPKCQIGTLEVMGSAKRLEYNGGITTQYVVGCDECPYSEQREAVIRKEHAHAT